MTAATLTLTDFLLARIAEDEKTARDIVGTLYWRKPGVGEADADAEHIARWSPARVLAECAAKRVIVAEHAIADPNAWDDDEVWCGRCYDYARRDAHHWPCDTVWALAITYADHPDYRDEWRP